MRMVDEAEVTASLRAAGARFAFVHGSRATGERARSDSDLDVGAWWGRDVPDPWAVDVPDHVDLVVLDQAPLWLAGRIALHGRLLFDDDPAARVAWQADTRLVWLDERPQLQQRHREFAQRILARGAARGR